jgi:transketolase
MAGRSQTNISDWDNQWRCGGSEADLTAEARLDQTSIFESIARFARERDERVARQRELLGAG